MAAATAVSSMGGGSVMYRADVDGVDAAVFVGLDGETHGQPNASPDWMARAVEAINAIRGTTSIDRHPYGEIRAAAWIA